MAQGEKESMTQILDLLIAERARIDSVIQILGGSAPKKRGRPPKHDSPAYLDSLRQSWPGKKHVADSVIDKSIKRKAKKVVSKATREKMKASAAKRWKAAKAEKRKAVKAKATKVQARATKDTAEKAA